MLYKLFFVLGLGLGLGLGQAAHFGFVPKFRAQDSAIIMDTDKQLWPIGSEGLHQKVRVPRPLPHYPFWQHFPRYHIIRAPPTWPKMALQQPTRRSSTTTTTTASTTTTSSTTTTTPAPSFLSSANVDLSFVTDDEFPKDLLNIAQTKLGLKSLDEIPSISELGQLLGTTSSEETLNYIRQLTANEQGIALLKAYIESTDYTDNTSDNDADDGGQGEGGITVGHDSDLVVVGTAAVEEEENNNNDFESGKFDKALKSMTTAPFSKKSYENGKVGSTVRTSPTSESDFLQRMTSFVSNYNMWSSSNEKENSEKDAADEEPPEIITTTTPTTTRIVSQSEGQAPILVRDPLPYHYPIPLRPRSSTSTTTTTTTTTITTTPLAVSSIAAAPEAAVVHLNTPKVFVPHVQQLSRVANIPHKKLEEFLAKKPKLLELAHKVSRVPIGFAGNSPMESQVLAVIRKAIEQDDDLKKLLNSTATLK